MIQYHIQKKKGMEVPTRAEFVNVWYKAFLRNNDATTMEEFIQKSMEKSLSHGKNSSDGMVINLKVVKVKKINLHSIWHKTRNVVPFQ